MMQFKSVTILLVEDNESDARLIREFITTTDLNSVIYTVNDGMECMDFLYMYCEYDCPDIVILGLNLLRMSSIEILKKIKNDSDLKNISIIILTTSDLQKEMEERYRNYDNCYFIKPADLIDFEIIINSIEDYWSKNIKSSTITF
jgi:FOG: CheY-like receiver